MNELAVIEKEAAGLAVAPEEVFSHGVKMSKLLMKALENSSEAVIEIQGKKYMKIQGWQVLGAFLGLSTEIVRTEKLENGWLAEAELRDRRGGRVAKGYGVCTRDEKGWKDKPEFALLAMAQTRAIGRALKLYCGWIVALAGIADTPYEEVEGVIEKEEKATEAQIKVIRDLCHKHGIEEPDYSKLSKEKASQIIDKLLKKKAENGKREAMIKSLHAWAKLAGLDETAYREYLKATFGKESSKDLTEEELMTAIEDMRQAWYELMPSEAVEGIDPLKVSYKEAKEITERVEAVEEIHNGHEG